MKARLTVGLVCAVVLTACGQGTNGTQHAKITVLAASSLTAPFTALAKQFDNGERTVTFDFAASSVLARQIADGADADVFASADEVEMDKLAAGRKVSAPVIFARNTLEIAVPKGNPKHIVSLADLANPRLAVAVCAASVPCGRFAAEALHKAGVSPASASREDNVRAVLTKVSLREADAGIVYASDTASSKDVDGLVIPAADNVVARYPIAVLAASKSKGAARAFIALLLSKNGQAALQEFGFLQP